MFGWSWLIENSLGILGDETDLSGDYRYMKDGKLVVGDYQTGELNPNKQFLKDQDLNINLLKAAILENAQAENFAQNYMEARSRLENQFGKVPRLSDIFNVMIREGNLPQLEQGTYHTTTGTPGIRAGKALSSSNTVGRLNYGRNPEIGRQYRYDNILYGLSDPVRMRKIGGAVPQELVRLDT